MCKVNSNLRNAIDTRLLLAALDSARILGVELTEVIPTGARRVQQFYGGSMLDGGSLLAHQEYSVGGMLIPVSVRLSRDEVLSLS